MAANKKSRGYCYTLPNYSEEDYSLLKVVECLYKIIGKEICPTTQTPHLQCYFYFKNARQFSAVKKLLAGNGHIEAAKGTPQENKTYCSKEGSFEEVGECPSQGQRNDISDAINTMKEHGVKRACEEHPEVMVKYHRGMLFVRDQVCPIKPRDFKTHLIVLVGPTGTGKSKMAAAISGSDVYYKPRGEWWDGYQQQNTVIIDDFYGWMQFDELLRLADRYPHKVPYKGGFHEFNSHVIFITSNILIDDWYKFEKYQERQPALLRRVCVYQTIASGEDIIRATELIQKEIKETECTPHETTDRWEPKRVSTMRATPRILPLGLSE